ncbi:hypothetical protein ABPG75_008966 [Micractinium tetrahymenae]
MLLTDCQQLLNSRGLAACPVLAPRAGTLAIAMWLRGPRPWQQRGLLAQFFKEAASQAEAAGCHRAACEVAGYHADWLCLLHEAESERLQAARARKQKQQQQQQQRSGGGSAGAVVQSPREQVAGLLQHLRSLHGHLKPWLPPGIMQDVVRRHQALERDLRLQGLWSEGGRPPGASTLMLFVSELSAN